MSDYIGADGEQQEEEKLLAAFAREAQKDNPSSPEVRELVQRWQAHVAAYHNGCSDDKLWRIGQLYGMDDRYSDTLDCYGPGTAHFMGDAILSYLNSR